MPATGRPRQPRKPPDATTHKGGFTGPALGLAVLFFAIAAGMSTFPRPEPPPPPPPPPPKTPQTPQSFDGPLPNSVSRALGATRDPAERWLIVQQLIAAGREEDAIQLLEHTVATLPEEAAAHEQLGEVLRASLRGGSSGSGAAEGEGGSEGSTADDDIHAAWWDRRRRAVAALNRSAALAPTAQLHATIGNLLAPRGEANSTDDAVGACQHYAAALALDATAHAGTTTHLLLVYYSSTTLLLLTICYPPRTQAPPAQRSGSPTFPTPCCAAARSTRSAATGEGRTRRGVRRARRRARRVAGPSD